MTDKSTPPAADYNAAAQNLQQIWQDHFPLSKAMGLRVAEYDGAKLTTSTPLHLNTNIHQTAFAGSLYAVQAMTCWGLLYLQLAAQGLDASIIRAHGNINFAKTVQEDIISTAKFSGHEAVLDTLDAKGKVRLEMTAEVIAAGAVASSFTGTYLARLNQ